MASTAIGIDAPEADRNRARNLWTSKHVRETRKRCRVPAPLISLEGNKDSLYNNKTTSRKSGLSCSQNESRDFYCMQRLEVTSKISVGT
jgi:hypothetical protein